jgi:hypothetical protein
MKSIAREQFLDQEWDAARLDLAGWFWLELYRRAASHYGGGADPECAVEITLWGFPRSKGEALSAELDRRAVSAGVPDPVVTLRDPDTIVLTSAPVPGPPRFPPGLGRVLLADPAPDGLAAEVRLRAVGPFRLTRGRWSLRPVRFALVVAGQVRGGRLLVKAVWRETRGWEEAEAECYRETPIVGEAEWVAGLERYGRTGSVAPGLEGWLAPPAWKVSVQRWLAELTAAPLDRPRLGGLLARGAGLTGACLVFGATSLVLVAGWVKVPGLVGAPGLMAAVLLTIAAARLLWKFFRHEARLLFSYRFLREAAAAEYAWPARYAVPTAEAASRLAADPAVCKHTADLAAEGFVVLCDVATEPVATARSAYRVFRAPDGVTYLALYCTHAGAWPAAVRPQAQTFFPGGGRVDTVGVATYGYGYRKYPTGPACLIRVDPAPGDPLDFYEAHRAAAEAFALENGLVPERHTGAEEYNRRQEAIGDEERQHFRTHPYSWADHLRVYLQLPRREQRG